MDLPHDIETEVMAREVIAKQYAHDEQKVLAAYRVIQRNNDARRIQSAAQAELIKLDAWQTFLLEDR